MSVVLVMSYIFRYDIILFIEDIYIVLKFVIFFSWEMEGFFYVIFLIIVLKGILVCE